MKTINILTAVALATVLHSAHAEDSCEVMRKVDGVLTSVKVPCSQLERPSSCTRQWRDERGSLHIEPRPCNQEEKKTVEQIQREETAAKKKQCGADFGKLRIGMTMDRYEQCTEAVDYVTKTVTKDGEVETYLGTFYLISARNGRIVSFTRRVH